MNFYAVIAIYKFEMNRLFRTLFQSLISPIISTSLYFIVFGTAIGSSIKDIDGITYGTFIVPGLMMLTLITTSVSNASFGIHMPKFTGTIFELLSAPVSPFEAILGYVGAAASKSILIGSLILLTANFFVPLKIEYPVVMIVFLLLTTISFSLFGFIIGIWATSWEKLNLIPLVILTPLVFLGGTFYSIDMLPLFWQQVSKLNPVFYLISGFRWSFFGTSEIPIITSFIFILFFMALCTFLIVIIFRSGYRLRN